MIIRRNAIPFKRIQTYMTVCDTPFPVVQVKMDFAYELYFRIGFLGPDLDRTDPPDEFIADKFRIFFRKRDGIVTYADGTGDDSGKVLKCRV